MNKEYLKDMIVRIGNAERDEDKVDAFFEFITYVKKFPHLIHTHAQFFQSLRNLCKRSETLMTEAIEREIITPERAIAGIELSNEFLAMTESLADFDYYEEEIQPLDIDSLFSTH